MRLFNLFCTLLIGSLIWPVQADTPTCILKRQTPKNKSKKSCAVPKIHYRTASWQPTSWRPTCLKNMSAQPAEGPFSFEKSFRTGLMAHRITLSENDIVASKNIRSAADDGQLNLQNFPPEALAILTTASQDFTSGLSGGMDLFGIRAMSVSPSANSIANHYVGASHSQYLF